MNMDMVNLDGLFTKKIFRVPDYQRGYVWQEKQLDQFWSDLQNLVSNKNQTSHALWWVHHARKKGKSR